MLHVYLIHVVFTFSRRLRRRRMTKGKRKKQRSWGTRRPTRITSLRSVSPSTALSYAVLSLGVGIWGRCCYFCVRQAGEQGLHCYLSYAHLWMWASQACSDAALLSVPCFISRQGCWLIQGVTQQPRPSPEGKAGSCWIFPKIPEVEAVTRSIVLPSQFPALLLLPHCGFGPVTQPPSAFPVKTRG